jgi:hypothetical protein
MTFFDRSLNHLKVPWARRDSNLDSVCSARERLLALSPWRAAVNNRNRPSWEQEGYSREPEFLRADQDSHSRAVPFVRTESLSGSDIPGATSNVQMNSHDSL